MGIVLKINMIAQLVLTGFAFGAVPLFGYLYGAGLKSTIQKLLRFCLIFLCTLSLILTAVLFLSSSQLMGLFINDSAVISIGSEMLRWLCSGKPKFLTKYYRRVNIHFPIFTLHFCYTST